jgi:hypothetical protein
LLAAGLIARTKANADLNAFVKFEPEAILSLLGMLISRESKEKLSAGCTVYRLSERQCGRLRHDCMHIGVGRTTSREKMHRSLRRYDEKVR